MACWMALPALLFCCMPSPPLPVFVTKRRPAKLMEQYAKGRLGVLQGTFDEGYLVGAYRTLQGRPMSDTEAAAFYGDRPDPGSNSGIDGYGMWRQERGGMPEIEGLLNPRAAAEVEGAKEIERNGEISYFSNCTEDAFGNAAKILAALRAKWGAADPRFLSWVKAQDQVFQNCSGKLKAAQIPEGAAAGMDAELSAHRRYQIAAAYLYSGDFRKSAAGFLAIAREPASPHSEIAPYLAVRALMRADQFAQDDKAYPEATKLIDSTLSDPKLAKWHSNLEILRGILMMRHEPARRAAELSAMLMKGEPEHDQEELTQAAIDLRFLLRRKADFRGRKLSWQRDWAPFEQSSDMTAWIGTMQRGWGEGKEAVARWRKSRSTAWLAAALAYGPKENLPELLDAAAKVPVSSSAYETIAYHRVARLSAAGRDAEARTLADQLLAGKTLEVTSTRNLLLSERMKLARDFEEFLRFSLRRPEEKFVNWERGEEPSDETPLPKGADRVFDTDAIATFNHAIPLSRWLDASRSSTLPRFMQLRIAQSGWLRASMLGREAEAKALLKRVVELQPTTVEPAKALLEAKNDEELQFGARHAVPAGLRPSSRAAGPCRREHESHGYVRPPCLPRRERPGLERTCAGNRIPDGGGESRRQ